MERVLGGMNKVILDGVSRRSAGAVSSRSLNELGRMTLSQGAGTTGGTNWMRAMYIIPAFVVLVLVLSSVFIVDERKKALVLQFGRCPGERGPGPWVQDPADGDAVLYEDRILGLQTQPIEVTLLLRPLVCGWTPLPGASSTWWNSSTSVGTAGEERAQQLLGNILSQAIPEVSG